MPDLVRHVAPSLLRLGLLLFAAGAIGRMIRFARMPLHVRWELYPVPHEKGRSAYGGSYLEELDWWTRPIARSRWGGLRVMAREVLLLAGVRERNRPLWVRSWPFHAGLYLIVVLALLLAAGGAAEALRGAPLAAAGAPGILRAVAWLTRWLAWAGPLLAAAGVLGLIARRAVDPDLRAYTSPAQFANLLFLLIALAAGLAARATADPTAALLRARVGEIVTWRSGTGTAAGVPWPVDLEIALFAVFIAYLPLTFMSHLYMKFFTYHQVRWDARPRRPGEPDPRLLDALGRPVSWAAPHIGGDGERTWGELLSGNGEAAARRQEKT